MFGKSNIDFRLDVHNERLNFLEGLVTRQEREIALLRQKKETEEPKNGVGFYEAMSVCCDFPQPVRWTVLADKCEKLQEENKKLKEEAQRLNARVKCLASIKNLSEAREAVLTREIEHLRSLQKLVAEHISGSSLLRGKAGDWL